jgi:hypothetical protein
MFLNRMPEINTTLPDFHTDFWDHLSQVVFIHTFEQHGPGNSQ